MFQSRLFSKTLREAPRDETTINAQLLVRAGLVDKLMAGVWAYLPLGYRVLTNINRVIREELGRIGGVELYMPALQPRDLWETTNRWNVEEMYKLRDRAGRELGLGWTHEELITKIATSFIYSYRDLPQYVYQIQDKFRDEPRAKSGLVRSREFLMKDLYSFHRDAHDLDGFYQKVIGAYRAIFRRVGLQNVYVVEASGGAFTKEFSHEFQILSSAGEDEIVYCSSCLFARNAEVAEGLRACPGCSSSLERGKSIEVGNIFKLGKKFSEAFGLFYQNERGEKQPVMMGSYGIGPGRLMGTVVEEHHDERGILWPEEIAPFRVHILPLSSEVVSYAEALYDKLVKRGLEVLLDDRVEQTAGERFSDADLIGIPWRVVVSEATVREGKIEVKRRDEAEPRLEDQAAFLERFS